MLYVSTHPHAVVCERAGPNIAPLADDDGYPPLISPKTKQQTTQPWVHYLPLKLDFSDLLEKMDWCEAHLSECAAVARRATQFVEGFNDTQKACRQGSRRLREYLDKVTVVVHD